MIFGDPAGASEDYVRESDIGLDDTVLSDPERLTRAGGDLLESVASAGAHVRSALAEIDHDLIAAIVRRGRPRAVVFVGAGGSSAAGEIVVACAGRGSAIPLFTTGGPGLPGWIGALDLVVVISAAGSSPEVLLAVAEAGRRGAHVVGVGGGGPLEAAVARVRGDYFGLGRVSGPVLARALTWRLAVPLLLLAQQLGLIAGDVGVIAAAADELDASTHANGPGVTPGHNVAAAVALLAAQGLPLAWGTPDVPSAVSRRAVRQFAETAGLPAIAGAFPEVMRTHARVLAGGWGAPEADFFRDRVLSPGPHPRPHLVVLRDDSADDLSADLASAAVEVATAAATAVITLDGGSGHPLLRYARISQPLDLAGLYAAATLGVDPMDTAAALHPQLQTGG